MRIPPASVSSSHLNWRASIAICRIHSFAMKVFATFQLLYLFAFKVSSASKINALKLPIRAANVSNLCKGPLINEAKEKNFETTIFRRWPNNEIPYTIDSTFNEDQILVIEASMAAIEISSCINFRWVQNSFCSLCTGCLRVNGQKNIIIVQIQGVSRSVECLHRYRVSKGLSRM